LGARTGRRVLIDLGPLRRSRDLRCLVLGELVSVLGTQLTTVAVPYQVYQLTRSSLYVGLVSLAQLFPLIAGSLLGGSAVDATDRRRLLIVAQVLMAGCSAGLAVNADVGTSLWPLFVLPALAAGFGGLDSAGRGAIVPNLVQRSEVPNANAIFQALFQFGAVAGPAVAGLLLAGAGVRFVYWMDVASFGAALVAVFLISPQPPAAAAGHRPGLRSIIEGLGFVRGRQAIQGAWPCPTPCGGGCPACRSRWSPAVRASGTWSPERSRPPSAIRCRWCRGAWPASGARCSWPGCCPASANSERRQYLTWRRP
jgi:MFS family permease